MGQFSNPFPKHFSYLCEYAFRFDLSCSFCEYPFIFHYLHCSPSCFDPDSLLLAHLWLGVSWIDSISANKRFSSPKTSSRKPYTSSKQQERQKHSAETTINFSVKSLVEQWFEHYGAPKEMHSGEDVRIPSDTGWYKRVLDALNVHMTTGVPYTHTSNPVCERQNRVLEQNVRILMKQERTKE